MTQNFNYDWDLVLRDYALDRHLDGEKNYNACQDIIQEAGDGFFRITGNATCRYSRNMAILQMKELPWEYLFQCMKISDKDFLIKLPTHLHDNKFRANSDGEVYVYAWYDPELNAIQVFNFILLFHKNRQKHHSKCPCHKRNRYNKYYRFLMPSQNLSLIIR